MENGRMKTSPLFLVLWLLIGVVAMAGETTFLTDRSGHYVSGASIVEVTAFGVRYTTKTDGARIFTLRSEDMDAETFALFKSRFLAARAKLSAQQDVTAEEAEEKFRETKLKRPAVVPSKPGTIDMKIGDGTVYRGVRNWALEAGGDMIKVVHDGGVAHVRIRDLSDDWKARVSRESEEKKQAAASADFDQRKQEADAHLKNGTSVHASGDLLAKHARGVSASLTFSESGADKKPHKVDRIVVLFGLPANKLSGKWSGTIWPKEVLSDRATDVVTEVWWAK
jgi:hypothetical protein